MELKTLAEVGEYTQLMGRVFTLPMRWRMFFRSIVREIYNLGVGSLWIVFIISLFIGAVITIIPRFTIGYSTREIMILEFSSTVMCLILSGKVGSSIASELGTMRVTEQIDAMEIMGVNSANFLILPKIVGFMLFIPVLSIFSMITGILGGYLACDLTHSTTQEDFVYGLQLFFIPSYIGYSIIKSVVYAFIISSVASYYGYCVKGGALQVGASSTRAVVNSSVLILFWDLLLTNILLT